MALVSFTEAAKLCGHRSRSQLYQMRNDGRLEGYLRPGPKGRWWLESHPADGEPLVSWVLACTRLQANSPTLALVERLERMDPPPPAIPWSGYVAEAGPDDPPLSHEDFWANVASLFDAAVNDVFPPKMSWQQAHSLWLMLSEVVESIEAGGRWDAMVWLRASLSDATENHEREWAQELLDSGHLSPDLEAVARQFLDSAVAILPEDGEQNP